MDIFYDVDGVKMPQLDENTMAKWLPKVAESYGKEVGEITYMFCNDEKILEVNNEYLQHDYYTDIITFDYSEDNTISGDLVISLDTVKSNSEAYKTDYNEELHRVMIHGILHLCGINDKTTEDEAKMRAAENEALEKLKTILEKL